MTMALANFIEMVDKSKMTPRPARFAVGDKARCYNSAVYAPTGQCRGARRGVADLHNLHIPIGIHAPLSNEKASLNIGERPIPAHSDSLSFHILWVFDSRSRHEHVLKLIHADHNDL